MGVGRQAQGVFGMFDIVNCKFDELPSSLEEGFTSTNQSSKNAAVRKCHRRARLGQNIRRLTNLDYHKASNDVRETLAKKQAFSTFVIFDIRCLTKNFFEHLHQSLG